MRRNLVAVGLDPGDLGLEQDNAFCQFVLRIGIKALPGQLASGIAARTGQIIIHRSAESTP